MTRLKYAIGILVLIIVVAFGYYAISPLFRNIKVNEAPPGAVYAPEMRMDDEMPAQGNDVSSVRTLAAAEIVDTLAHPASGTVKVIEADGKRYVRYENYKTLNGPDIYVYLAKDTDAKEFVSLGRVKATEGNINYEIPDGIDPREYPYVLTWCQAFGVLFNSAKMF